MILGMQVDNQFGLLVIFGFGGVHAEVLKEAVTAMPPFGAAFVEYKLAGLRLAPLLEAYRGRSALAVSEFANMVARFSELAAMFGAAVDEIDINPVLLTERRCIGLDALIIPAKR